MAHISGSLATAIVTLTVYLAFPGPARAQSVLDIAWALNQRAMELGYAGKAGEAIPLAKDAFKNN